MRYNQTIQVLDEQERLIDEIQANLTTTGTEKQLQLFGNMKADRMTVRVRHFTDYRSGYILFEGNKYQILQRQQHSKGTAFYVEEWR